MKAKQVILTHQLPKTGGLAAVPPADYEDYYYHAGWWKGRDYDTNKTRFIAKTIDGDDVVIDRATGLMWAADGVAVGCGGGALMTWTAAVAYGSTHPFAGFNDWRLPNIFELMSILDYSTSNPTINTTLFPNTFGGSYWSSTPSAADIGVSWYVVFASGSSDRRPINGTIYIRCVRGGL